MIQPTPQQQAAIDAKGNVVVTARPGSGKTFTLACMIAHDSSDLLSYQGVIAISYTNKASDELKERCDRLGVERGRSFFGTIDSFCLGQIVAPFLPHVTRSVKDIAVFEDEKSKEWLYLKGRSVDDPEIRQFLQESFESGRLPIGALGPAALLILETVSQARAFVKARYTSIFIDEYQDCGLYQHMLMKLLVSYGLRGVAVGDVDQAIFQFAGKSPEHLRELMTSSDFRHFQITENHRCDKAIQSYSLALLGVHVDSIRAEDRRVFAVHMDGDETALSRGIRERLPSIMRKYSVEQRCDVALLVSSNHALDLYGTAIGIPHKLYRRTPLDDGFSKWNRIFSDLLMIYFDPTRYSGQFVDRHFEGSAKPAKRSHCIALVDELFSLPEEGLAKNVGLAIDIATLCAPGAERLEDIDAYRMTVEDLTLLRDGFRPAKAGEVNILTYHKAKGLEFDIVFCLETYRFVMPIYKWEEKGGRSVYDQALAVHYVGITRARKACYVMLGTKRHNGRGVLMDASPSEFLDMNGLRDLRNEPTWR